MLEKIDKKKSDKLSESEIHLNDLKRQIEIRQIKLEEETYQRDTTTYLIERMKEENLSLQKKININEVDVKRNLKELTKQKFKSTEIKEKLNQMHLKTEYLKKVGKLLIQKNQFDKNEHVLVTQYYNAVIDNKWNFIKTR